MTGNMAFDFDRGHDIYEAEADDMTAQDEFYCGHGTYYLEYCLECLEDKADGLAEGRCPHGLTSDHDYEADTGQVLYCPASAYKEA